MRVTAIVVNYNSAPDIHECLERLRASDHPVDIVVVDNASTDGSPERLERDADVQLIRSDRNLGFAGGVNLGARAVPDAEAILLVNPDAIIEPDTVGRLVKTLRELPGAAAVGPLVLNPDRTIQPSKRTFPTWTQAAMHATVGVFWPNNPGTRAYVCADLPDDRPSRVGWLSGSVLLLRGEAFRQVGMFDEDFFFYVEDVDLCRRLSGAGWSLWFEPRAFAVHAWGGSTRRPTQQLLLHHRNLYRYVRKHQSGWRNVTLPFVAAGLSIRFSLLWVRARLFGRRLPAHHATTQRRARSARQPRKAAERP